MDRTSRLDALSATRLVVGGLLLLACACGGGGGETVAPPPPPPPPPPVAPFTGFVGDEETVGVPVAGAQVTVGSLSTTTGQDGQFALPSVPVGSHVVTVSAPGFITRGRDITIRAGNNSASFLLPPASAYLEIANMLVYLPANVSTFRGAFLVLYGGTDDTRPLLRGEIGVYQNRAALGDIAGYREALRAFVKDKGFVVIGMQTPPLTELGAVLASDILSALADAGRSTGHSELAVAPLFLEGMSLGGCAVHRIVAEIPSRVIGFISMKAGPECGFPGDSPVFSVPGYFFLGGLDASSIAVSITGTFEQNRARGAVWALAIEAGAAHTWVSDHGLIFNWAGVVAAQRLPATVTPGAPVALRPVGENSGWLGDRTSFSIARYACFPGDKLKASWLPSEQTAHAWQSMMGTATTVVPCP